MESLISAYLQDISMGKLEVNKNWKVFNLDFNIALMFPWKTGCFATKIIQTEFQHFEQRPFVVK